MNRREPNRARSRRHITCALATTLLLTLTACGGGGGVGGDASETGTLDITVTGLPAGTAASIVVSGPANFGDTLTGSAVLTDLVAGTYTVAAHPVAAVAPVGATFDPVRPTQTATVVDDAVADATVEYDLHECVAYAPTQTGGDLSGSWEASGSAGDVFETITVPSDPGGGFVTVRLHSGAGVRPGLDVQVLPLATGSIFTESTDPAVNPDPTLLEMVFEVAPGRSYQLRLRAASAVGITFPQAYTASWTFTSRVDCYEPNDTIETAKAIPMENPITASFIAGFRESNSIPALSIPTLDFYRIQLHTPRTLRITLSDVADTVRPRLVLYTDAGSTIGTGALAPAAGAGAVYESAGALPAGWYRVRVDTQLSPSSFSREAHVSRSDEDVPPHFLQGYTLLVEALD